MKQETWPSRSDGHRFRSFQIRESVHSDSKSRHRRPKRIESRSSTSSSSEDELESQGFAALPFDILARIAAPFTLPDLQAASMVCKTWSEALKPLREAMVFLRWGKRFKHGRGGVKPDVNKALESFLKGAVRGSSLAMVDAGLVYWEIGEKEKAIGLYRKAAELGDPAGQCNLGIYYLQGRNLQTRLKL
ncbi:F-box protein At1g70590 [Linum perenne]